jgi:hypothetical protein
LPILIMNLRKQNLKYNIIYNCSKTKTFSHMYITYMLTITKCWWQNTYQTKQFVSTLYKAHSKHNKKNEPSMMKIDISHWKRKSMAGSTWNTVQHYQQNIKAQYGLYQNS